MPDSTITTEARTCAVCAETFEFAVRGGRKPLLCSDGCRRISARLRVRRYHKRLTDARDQLAALQVAQTAQAPTAAQAA